MSAPITTYHPSSYIPAASKGRRVLVGGCFDLLHYGHVVFLTKARQAGDLLIVALESDDFIQTRKNRQPVHTQQQRAEILAALRVVDEVVLLPLLSDHTEYEAMVAALQPSVIGITQDDPLKSEKERQAQNNGAHLEVLTPVIESFSSSAILDYAHLFRD